MLLIVNNTGSRKNTRWRLIVGQDEKSWPEISIFGKSIVLTDSTKNENFIIVNFKPTLGFISSLKINISEIQMVLEKKTEAGWEVIRMYNFKIKEVKEKEPRFLP